MFTLVYPWLPMFTHVYPCLPLFTHVYPCLPLFTHVYPCLPLFTHVYYVYHVYPSLPMFTLVYPCLLCLPCLPGYILIGLKDGRKSRHISEKMRKMITRSHTADSCPRNSLLLVLICGYITGVSCKICHNPLEFYDYYLVYYPPII